ncbi:MAG: 2-dehydropantoate 2-reductase [Chloroflexi bacterium]|nr:2-dehydropantoate 2-reductase [Chloroflexota bacterium]
MTRIGIIGAGAIGGVVGGLLTRAGYDVTLIDHWVDHINEMKANGLRLTGPLIGDIRVPVKALHIYEVQGIAEPFDIGMVSVKSYDTEWATHLLNPLVLEDGVVVDMQNGINDERVAAIAGRERTLGCVITIGAGMYDPGHCIRTDSRTLGFKIGELDGSDSDRARDIAEIFNHVAGSESTTNLWGERWGKLAVNCMANPVAGLSGYASGELRTRDDSRWLCIRLAAEVVEVGRAYGHQIDTVWGIPSQMFVDVANGGDPSELDAILISGAQEMGAGRPSFLQDVIRGRRVEIDALNGWVVEQGKAVEVATPINAAVTEVVRSFPVGELRSDPANIGRIMDLVGPD